jgi:hypothetical protein
MLAEVPLDLAGQLWRWVEARQRVQRARTPAGPVRSFG